MRIALTFLLISIFVFLHETKVAQAEVSHAEHHHEQVEGHIHPKKHHHAENRLKHPGESSGIQPLVHKKTTGNVQPAFGMFRRIFGPHRIDGHFNHHSTRHTNITFKIDSGKKGNGNENDPDNGNGNDNGYGGDDQYGYDKGRNRVKDERGRGERQELPRPDFPPQEQPRPDFPPTEQPEPRVTDPALGEEEED